MMNKGLYIHLPFCKHICSYCDFAKRVSKASIQEKYISALIEELLMYQEEGFDYHQITTLYIGGGTPTALNLNLLRKLLETLSSLLDLKNLQEFTIEANPEDLSEELSVLLNSYAVTRVSIGIQSFNKRILKLLNRSFDEAHFIKEYQFLHQLIPNINFDLMYAIPSQTLQELKETLAKAIQLKPDHLSIYSLILEEKTLFHHMVTTGQLELISEDLEMAMVQLIDEMVIPQYPKYEVSNYANAKHQSLHNLGYWNNLEYLGVGLSAASYLNGVRFQNTKDLKTYLESIANHKFPISEREVLSKYQEKQYHLILGFRKCEGINLDNYMMRFHSLIYQDFSELYEFLQLGYFEEIDGFIRIKPQYFYVMNYLLERII